MLARKILVVLFLIVLSAKLGATETEPDELPNVVPPSKQKPKDHTQNSDNTTPPPKPQAQPISFLKSTISPGTFRTLHWSPGLSMDSLNTPVPVLVAHGAKPGPTLCLTAAIHGDELNGIEIVRRVLHQTEPDELSGTIIGMPIVNLDGFRRASRYMTDRRDLNRFFPGNPLGSFASRVAYSLFNQVIINCDYLLDIHTGSFKRTNLAQLRGDLKNKDILEFSSHFGGMSVLHHSGGLGTLRRAAADAGISAITMETGGPHILDQKAVVSGVKGIKNMLHNLGMYQILRLWAIPQPVFYQSIWVRSNQGGILLGLVELDQKVKQGEILGRVIDPITNTSSDIVSPLDGIVLGKAVDQVVSPGYATFHIGRVTTEEKLADKAQEEVTPPAATPAEPHGAGTQPMTEPAKEITPPATRQTELATPQPAATINPSKKKDEKANEEKAETPLAEPNPKQDTKQQAPSKPVSKPKPEALKLEAPKLEKPKIESPTPAPAPAPDKTEMPIPSDLEDESIMDMGS